MSPTEPMRSTPAQRGGALGLVLAVPVLLLLYLGALVVRLPFVPFDLVLASPSSSWSQRLLGVVIFMGGAVLFGALIGRNAARTTRPAWQVGARTGSFLAVALILFELTVGESAASPGVTALYLTVLIAGWGLAVGRLLQRTLPGPDQAPA